MRSSLNRNLLVGFSISLLLLIISSAASFVSIQNLLASAEKVNHTNEVKTQVNEILSIMKDAETGQRGFLLTNDEVFLEPYNGSYKKVQNSLAAVKSLTIDNPVQQRYATTLDSIIERRFSFLGRLIDLKRGNEEVSVAELRTGKSFMDSIRTIVRDMAAEENSLLELRTKNLAMFSSFTPVLIVITALVSLIITIIFYFKVKKDINDKISLQQQLVKKDIEISRRIDVIENIANKISAGNFSIRIKEEEEKDKLGDLGVSLNKMASSLEVYFKSLSDKEWLQAGIAGLNENMIGDTSLQNLTERILTYIAPLTNSLAGTLYLSDNTDGLIFQSGFAIDKSAVKSKLQFGEGLVGQCAENVKEILISNISTPDIMINFTTAAYKPASIVVFPVTFEKQVKGVIELAALHAFSERELLFLRSIPETIGIAINTVQNRQRVQDLLEETQAQSEELMTQHAELEHMNAELEAQSQQLQSSEEELRVQQEELMETNSVLEERSSLLEDRNMVVQQKNMEIEKKIEELALSTKYKSEFLANMSHELRTPLNSILLLSRLMEENNEQNLTPDQVKYAQVIQSSGKGLLELIDEILDLSKIEAGKMTVEYTVVLVDTITHDIQQLFEQVAIEKDVEWLIKVEDSVGNMIETDKLRLEQILKNLLSNAFKFTKKGYVHLNIEAVAGRPGMIAFKVKDSGLGIAADKQKMIFEAFQQEDGSTRRRYGGTGLGLSISRELAKLLGGEITLQSQVGEGSEFTLLVPATAAGALETEKPDAPFVTNSPAFIAEEITPVTDQQYTADSIPAPIADDRENITEGDKIILIIEDDTAFAKALLDYTHKKGYKGLVAVRGDHGIEMASQYKLAGILLDIQLPVKNGWQVIDALKNNPATRAIPVHIMSSFEVKRESLLKGAVDFINKPVAFEQLSTIFDKLEYVLGKKDKKVLIVEENYKHAKALSYFLDTHHVNTEIYQTVPESIQSLYKNDVDCVILDMGVPDANSYDMLETIRQNKDLEDIPIIIFTGKSISKPEELKIKKYADSIVLKTAHSYQRILDEVSLFLHLVESNKNIKKLPGLNDKSLVLENVLKNKSVLLADDDVRNIFAMTKALEKHHMKVIPALDGKEALEFLKGDRQVDIILMDMMMPEMDGYETIKAIRSNPLTASIPIIAVTAKAMIGDREKCITAGASDYISKPVDMDQMVSLLRIWLYEKSY